MIDAQQWMIDLMAADIGKVVGGIMILVATTELLYRIKGWITQ